jgi:hypothetical protein
MCSRIRWSSSFPAISRTTQAERDRDEEEIEFATAVDARGEGHRASVFLRNAVNDERVAESPRHRG